MPTYAYACTSCDNRFEVHQSFSDDSLTRCERCEGTLRKLFNSVGIVFKGSGFYRTDSRAATSAAATAGSSNGSSGKESSKESSKASSKDSGGSGTSDSGSGGSTTSNGSSSDTKKAAVSAAKT